MDDVRKAITMDAKSPGDLVYILGETLEELGGSEYYASKSLIGNRVPGVNAEKARSLYKKYTKLYREG